MNIMLFNRQTGERVLICLMNSFAVNCQISKYKYKEDIAESIARTSNNSCNSKTFAALTGLFAAV